MPSAEAGELSADDSTTYDRQHIFLALASLSRAVVRFYNKWGTAEQWIKEGKQAVKMTRISCHRFRSNQARLALSLLAYNLGNL
jgi:Transposase DDE domain group 1